LSFTNNRVSSQQNRTTNSMEEPNLHSGHKSVARHRKSRHNYQFPALSEFLLFTPLVTSYCLRTLSKCQNKS